MNERAIRFGILASGRGSNADALMSAFSAGQIPEAQVSVVIANRAEAGVLERAKRRGVEALVIPSAERSRHDHEMAMLEALGERRIDHLLLAGYMRVLSRTFLRGWRGSILNIHPSLLPEFPGLHAQRRQWDAGVRVAGATVHYVDDGVDTGPILLQGSIDVRGDEGAEGLSERILEEVEHVIYARAVRLFLERQQRAIARKEPENTNPGAAGSKRPD